jgi:hypothetical protein
MTIMFTRPTSSSGVQPVPPSLIMPAGDVPSSEIVRRVAALQSPPSPGSALPAPQAELDDLAHRLFEALAAVKIHTSTVAMHLDKEWRDKLFRQLDSLHDMDEWELDDEPIQKASFDTFLKAMLSIKPKRRPGLGLSHAGHLVAAWTTNQDRLTIEFLAHDRVRWVLSRKLAGDEPERFAGETRIELLAARLAEYNPEHWFSYAEKTQQPA